MIARLATRSQDTSEKILQQLENQPFGLVGRGAIAGPFQLRGGSPVYSSPISVV